MFTITFDAKQRFGDIFGEFSKAVQRSAELALDRTVVEMRNKIRPALSLYFDRPTPYTLNSLQITKTQGHVLQASVWFKQPSMMRQHYLVPQVEGGMRPQKHFEQQLDDGFYMPSLRAVNAYGNLPYGRIVQILSVLGMAEYAGGYTANLSARSAKRNRNDRDYVLFKQAHGRLPAGVYQRLQTGPGFGAKTKKTLPFGAYQRGQTRGKFSSVVRARRLSAVLLRINQPTYTKRFPFYEMGGAVANARLWPIFLEEMANRR
jgi:hypothetical protein